MLRTHDGSTAAHFHPGYDGATVESIVLDHVASDHSGTPAKSGMAMDSYRTDRLFAECDELKSNR